MAPNQTTSRTIRQQAPTSLHRILSAYALSGLAEPLVASLFHKNNQNATPFITEKKIEGLDILKLAYKKKK
jgi:hypothetical protein